MDASTQKRRATYQDVIDAPENMIAEIIDGELHLSPRPAGPATSVATVLTGELEPRFGRGKGGPGGWIILLEPELHLADDVLVPDLAGWRRDRMSVVPDDVQFKIVPDWVCEVLSPSTEKRDRIQKMQIYARAGVKHLWLVHPRRRSLEAFRLHEGKWLLIATLVDDERGHIEPFDAIELDLPALWADLPLPTRASEESDEDYEYSIPALP
jgi:Uma2 family endonuclease